jgi:protein O-GlcNAc transferase
MHSNNEKLVQAIELQNAGKIDDATVLFREILGSDPNNAAALYSHGVISLNKGQVEEAFRLSDHGVKVAPSFAPMHFVHGAALLAMGKKEEALSSYDAALQIQPEYTEVLQNSGVLLREMLRHREALERFNKILTYNPDNPTALANCGIVLTEFKLSEQAIAMFKRLMALQPDYDYGLGLLLYEQLHVCDWSMLASLSQQIMEGVRAGKRSCKTLALMAITDSASDHYLAARTFADHFFPKAPKSLWNGERYRHEKIRIAYLSPDLREHPVGHLMAGIFERHDKSRFETFAFSLGPDDGSRLRARMLNAFDHFIDVRTQSSVQIAQQIRELEIDILIDLAGYTTDSRTDVMAWRPAPVHVNYLGYPGTLGVDYVDYILADRYIIPEAQQQYFSEKVVYLPDTYLPTDAGVSIAERTPTRAECGLPESGVVFCSFSHDYKISPYMFDVWMRLLQRIPGSVLWLMARGATAQQNLCREARERGIDPARLVFAGRVPRVEDHLARYRLVDLFLDTHPYNAHTTAADAMMAGCPVVTCMGDAFPSRVAGSLLHAIGLPELIAHTLNEYEDIAFRLATSPSELADIKSRLRANRETHALFDTDQFCRNLETAYIAMWRQAQLGGARDELQS